MLTLIEEVRRGEDKRLRYPRFWVTVLGVAFVVILVTSVVSFVMIGNVGAQSMEADVAGNKAKIDGVEKRVDDFREVQRYILDTLKQNEGRITKLEATYSYNNALLVTLCGGLALLILERLGQYFLIAKRRNGK